MSQTPPSPTNLALSIKDVHFAYQRQPVLVGMKWEVPTGRLAAVLGATGAGKSTLLAVLAGAYRPTGGSVEVLGGDPTDASTKRLIGFMPQVEGLYTDLSVEDNLRVFAGAAGVRQALDDLVERTLELVGLRSRRKEVVSKLSAGWRQRVSLGAALIAQPQVLLLDEPLAHADPEFADKLWAHLRDLASKGRTVLIATSHPHVAARAQLVGVMRGGRLVVQGATADLASPGRAAVRLTYREKTGPLARDVQMEDYRSELPQAVHGQVAKPVSIEVTPETIESQLARMLTEEPGHARP